MERGLVFRFARGVDIRTGCKKTVDGADMSTSDSDAQRRLSTLCDTFR
jgi:hypothetical protein